MMTADATPPRLLSVAAAVVAIAATYGYFLLFAEFALLELAKPVFGDERSLRPLLAVLGAGGLIGSLAAAGRFDLRRLRGALTSGFAGCALAAALALAGGRGGLWCAAAAAGLSLGWTTVTLSAGLRASAGAARLGLWCGLGTGLAYAAINLPPVFDAAPRLQTMLALGFAALGAAAVPLLNPAARATPATPDYRPRAQLGWVAIFLALVWFDSAGFYIFQHTPGLRAQTWAGAEMLYGNALTHLLGALLAGYALDARRLGGTALAALVLLAVADTLIGRGADGFPGGARALYTMGVSAYSVALVYYPAFGARPWLAAGLFVTAGWIGSALGIGMVQDLHSIPAWFISAASAVVLTALALRYRRPRISGAALLVALGALGFGPDAARADDANFALGREVYISEGCINCHSQFVRPGVRTDVEWWGPARPLAAILAENPPLIGLRRQGPDLMNVGNRRSAEWQRLHLIAPQAVAPGSRMPGYAHLFGAGDSRGEALVAYLTRLGAETLPARLAQAAAWIPLADALAAPVNAAGARRTFGQLCAGCHGPAARGDGSLVPQLSIRPPDFAHDAWRHLPADATAPTITLARLIKFGVPGTAMAGHEYLDDATLVQLARLVETLHRRPE